MVDIIPSTTAPVVTRSAEDRKRFEDNAFVASINHSTLPELDREADQGIGDAITKGIPSLGLAAVETLGSSLGLLNPEEYQASLARHAPDIYNYYKRNEDGVKLIADIATAFIPATAGVKAIQGTSWLARLAKGSRLPHADKLFTSNSKFNTAYRKLREADRSAARRGATGDAFAEARKVAARNFRRQKLVDGLKEGVAAEALLYASMNDSEVLYPSDFELTTHLAFAGLGAALPVGVNALIARRLIAQAARKAAPQAIDALNVWSGKLDIPTAKIVAREGEEHLPITILTVQRKGIEDYADDLRVQAAGDADAQGYVDNMGRFVTSIKKKTNELIERVARNKVPGLIGEDTPAGGKEVLNTLKSAVEEDELSLLGVVAAQSIPGSMKEISELSARRAQQIEAKQGEYNALYDNLIGDQPYITGQKELSKAELAELNGLADELFAMKNRDLFVLSPRGEYIPIDEYAFLYRDDLTPTKPQIETIGVDKGAETSYRLAKVGPNNVNLEVDIGLTPAVNGKHITGGLQELDNYSVDALYALYDRAINRIRPDNYVIITDDTHWMRAEAVMELLRRKPDMQKQIKFTGPKVNNLDQLQMKSLDSKFEEYRAMHHRIGEEGITAESLRHRFNLPAWSRGEANPTEELFVDLIQQGVTGKLAGNSLIDNIPSFDDFKAMVSQRLTFGSPDTMGSLLTNIQLRGNQFAQKLDTPNVMVYKQYLPHDAYSIKRLEDAIFKQVEAATSFERAIAAGSPLVGRVAELVTKSSAFPIARNVKELTDSARLGTGTVNTARFSTRELPTMQAAHDLQTILEKETRTFVGELYDASNKIASTLKGSTVSHATVFAELRSADNIADLVSFSNYINARRHAWDLLEKVKEHDDGAVSFILDPKSQRNYSKLRELYGDEVATTLMPAEDDAARVLMPATSTKNQYTPLRITPRAHAAAEAFRDMGLKVRNEHNLLRRQKVLPDIALKHWWIPPEHFGHQHIAFLVSILPDGSSRKFLVKGRTNSELQRKLLEPEVIKFRQENHTLQLTPEDFERYFSLRDDIVYQGMENVDTTLFAAGKTAQLTSDDGRAYLDGAVDFLRDHVNSISKRTMATIFEPELGFAKMMSEMLVAQRKTPYRNIYDDYAKTLLGTGGLNEQYGLGKVFLSTESLYDDILLKLYDKTESRRVTGAIKEKLSRTSGHLNRQLEKVRKELGQDAPVSLTVDELARITNVRPPPSMQKQMAALNQLTSFMVLRMAEVAHPLLNFSGVVNTMPGIINALQKRNGESRTDWQARISAFGTPLSNTQDIAALSPVKLMSQATYHGFTDQGGKDWLEMVRRGYGRQEVAEIQRTITNPQSSLSLGKVADTLGYMSDKSEELSRGWAHMAGVKIAREHLDMTDVGDIHLFAHKFANEVIGDYRASNRPQIFQGAVGLPLGLFQTYIWNYYQRLFSYVENRQYSALAWQGFTQAAVFGGVSLPGFRAFQDIWHDADKATSPIDALNRRLGPDLAEVVLNGTLSNIPKIWGDDGIALYTRGDTNFQRMPAFIDPRQAPIWQLANRTFNIMRDSVDQHLPGGQFSWQRQMEILGTYSMNRPLSRLMELAAGYSVDRRGQLITDDVYSGLSIAARVMSMRPLAEQKQIETLYRQRQTEYTQRALRKRTRDSIRSKIREGSIDSASIQQALRDYVEQGGNPAYFPNFLKDQILAAKSPKITNEILSLLNSGKLNEAARLYSAIE